MLYEAKKSFLSDTIIYCGRDMKKLYNIVSNMIGMKVENPMPKHDSKIELANEVAIFSLVRSRIFMIILVNTQIQSCHEGYTKIQQIGTNDTGRNCNKHELPYPQCC